MHPSSGEISSAAHTPQWANSAAMAIIRRLSVLRFPVSAFSSSPNSPPSSMVSSVFPRGSSMLITWNPLSDSEADAREIAML